MRALTVVPLRISVGYGVSLDETWWKHDDLDLGRTCCEYMHVWRKLPSQSIPCWFELHRIRA